MKPEELASFNINRRRRAPVQPMPSSLKAENQIRQLTQKVHRNIAVLSTIQASKDQINISHYINILMLIMYMLIKGKCFMTIIQMRSLLM